MWIKSLLVVLCLVLVFGVSMGCAKAEKEGLAEKVGKELDSAADAVKVTAEPVGEEIAEGAEELTDGAEDVGEGIAEGAEEVMEEVEEEAEETAEAIKK
jgi:methyl-accepting chemotaxis protein